MRVRSILQRKSTIHPPTTPRSSGLCNHHELVNLKSIFSLSRQGRLYDFGYVDDILSEPNCPFCRFIQSWIYKNNALFETQSSPIKCELCPQGSRFNEENDFSSLQDETHTTTAFNYKPRALAIHLTAPCLLVMFSSFEDVSFSRRLIWLWLGNSCKGGCETHGAFCSSTELQCESEIFEFFRLIDVQTRVVVTVKLHVEYVALSYVWGDRQLQTFMSKKSNSFDSSGQLVDLNLPSQLPATIEDAISVTKQLCLCYTWVDVVCIVQDGGDLKSRQISQMA